MKCPSCHKEQSEEASFCMHCGTKLQNKCSQCGMILPIDASFCMACGHKLKEPDVKEVKEQFPESLVTFISADIHGSTELISDKDVEWATEILERVIAIMSQTVKTNHGRVLVQTGDGVVACFQEESHALQACYAAALMQQAVRSENLPIGIRVGIHSSLSARSDMLEGADRENLSQMRGIKIAQLIEAVAPLGGVAISQTCYRLCKDYIETGSVRQVEVPGEVLPINAYEIYRVLPSAMKAILAPKVEEEEEDREFFVEEHKIGEGERKFITSCFIKLIYREADDEYRSKVSSLVKKTMLDFEGTYIKQVGETMFAVFGAPVAFEDHPLRACLAAYTLRDQLIEKKLHVDLRVGIHSGEAVYVKDNSHKDAYGASVNLAARMMQTAPSDHIQLSSESLSLVEKYVQTIPLGEKFVKGFSKAVTTYALVGIDHDAIRNQLEEQFYGSSRFYGRKEEMKLFSLALSQANQQHGSFLAFKAEPGMGKTRLMYEFCRVILENGMIFYSVSSSAYEQKDSFSTLRQFMGNVFSFGITVSKKIHSNRLSNILRGVPFSENFAHAAIITMLGGAVEDEGWNGLDPALQLEILFQSLWEYLEFQSKKNPVVLVFEDLQWCDEDSFQFLKFLVLHIKNSRLLLLLDYRYELELSREFQKLGKEIELAPLEREESEKIIDDLLPGGDELIPLREKVLNTSLGNPFYIEEYVKALITNKTVIETEDGYALSKAVDLEVMPQTLKGLISSRIDQLSVIDKDLLQQASIFGRVFKLSLLRFVSELDAEPFRSSLISLEEKGFIIQTALFPEMVYSFKHNYISEVAYGTMLRKTKVRYHNTLVEQIEKNHSDSLSDYYHILATHSYLAEQWRKALNYYNLYMPDNVSINFSIVQYLATGPKIKELYGQLNKEEKEEVFRDYCRAICLWLHSLLITGGADEALKVIKSFISEAKEQKHEVYELVALSWEVVINATTGKASYAFEKSQQILARIDAVFDGISDKNAGLIKDGILLWIVHALVPLGKYEQFDDIINRILGSPHDFDATHFSNGVAIKSAAYANFFWWNTVRARVDVLQEKVPYLVEVIEHLPEAEPRILAQVSLVSYHFLVGDFNATEKVCDTALSSLMSMQLGFVEASAVAIASMNTFYRGDEKEALKLAKQAIATYQKIHYAHTSFGAAMAAEVFSFCGKYDEALEVLEELLAIAEADNQKPLLAQCYRVKAMTYNLMDKEGKHDQAILDLLDQSDKMTEDVQCNLQRPFIYLNYSEFYSRVGDEQQANEYFHKALDSFKKYKMSGWYELFKEKKIKIC